MIDASINIGNKFNEDGSVRFFPGNTIVSMISHEAEVWKAFCTIREMLLACPASHCLTLLPDESIHTTIFEGVCHQWREGDAWTSLLPLDCTLTETDDLFEEQLKSVKPLGHVNMKLDCVGYMDYGFNILLSPCTEADAEELRRYRNDCSKAMGIRHKIHDIYRHHISMGYFTTDGTDAEEAELRAFVAKATEYLQQHEVTFTVQTPKLTFFNDMFYFHPERVERNGL